MAVEFHAVPQTEHMWRRLYIVCGVGLASFAYFGVLAHGSAPEPLDSQGGSGGSVTQKVKEVKDKATAKNK